MKRVGCYAVFAIYVVWLISGREPVSAAYTARSVRLNSYSDIESANPAGVSQVVKPRKLKHAARKSEDNPVHAVTKAEDDRTAVSWTGNYLTGNNRVENNRVEGDRAGLFEVGRLAYAKYCIGCHGASGDGKGESAGFLYPKPRDFILAHYKFSSTRSGSLPTDSDLERTIRAGLRGTAMSGWKLLPDRTVEALVVYIKRFSPKWQHRLPAPKIPKVADPYRKLTDKAVAIARGEVVYHGFASCWSCHPAYVSTVKINEYLAMMENPLLDTWRTNLNEAVATTNEFGEIDYPPDFRRDFVRAGMTVADLYRSIAAGITGTSMPTWADSMNYKRDDGSTLVKPSDLWAMAYYVQSLIEQRPAKIAPDAIVVRQRPMSIRLNGRLPAEIEDPTDAALDTETIEPDFFED